MQILEGKKIAARKLPKLAIRIRALPSPPGLAIITSNEDEASKIYVQAKIKEARKVGIKTFLFVLPKKAARFKLINLIKELNAKKECQGIILQLPLPSWAQGWEKELISLLDPRKDVDGLHPLNLGHLFALRRQEELNSPTLLLPPTSRAVLTLLAQAQALIAGKKAVVIGRSLLAGKPIAQLLLLHNLTVTQCHSQTVDLAEELRRADVVVSAVGKAGLVQAALLKRGAVVIDVGISRDQKGSLRGDLFLGEEGKNLRAFSPVPGGVGPLTVYYLLENVYRCYLLQNKIDN